MPKKDGKEVEIYDNTISKAPVYAIIRMYRFKLDLFSSTVSTLATTHFTYFYMFSNHPCSLLYMSTSQSHTRFGTYKRRKDLKSLIFKRKNPKDCIMLCINILQIFTYFCSSFYCSYKELFIPIWGKLYPLFCFRFT